MSSDRYKSWSHLPKVKQSANVRLGTYIVLSIMCDRSEMDRPEVTITKREIEAKTGLCKKTIKKALQHLRALKVIVPIKGFEGGSGVATTYRLCDLGQGDAEQPEVDEKGRKCPPKLFSEWHKRFGINEAFVRKARYEAGEDIE